MESESPQQVCSFCGTPALAGTRQARGFGVFMCQVCVDFFAEAMTDSSRFSPDDEGRLVVSRVSPDDLSDAELLEILPRIAAGARQTNRFMGGWVELLRARHLSWATIGTALGVSRQAAWERFARIVGQEQHAMD